MSNIMIERIGSRVYLGGNTYPIKAAIKSAGGHWDADRKQWWVGAAKEQAIRDVVEKAQPEKPVDDSRPSGPAPETVVGKAQYKGRSYYVVWAGETKRGYAMKLTTLDGRIVFWAQGQSYGHSGDPKVACWIKQYQEPQSLARIRRFAEEARSARDNPENCPRCQRMFASGRARPYCGSGDYDDCPVCGATYAVVH